MKEKQKDEKLEFKKKWLRNLKKKHPQLTKKQLNDWLNFCFPDDLKED